MKKYFLLAVAAVAVMASCSKKEMPQPVGSIDDSAPAKVQFNLDAPSLVVTKTKGAGAVDAWNKQPLYILGYENNVSDYGLATVTPLIPNVPVDAPAAGVSGALELYQQTHGEYGDIDEPYYYASSAVYDFYGYYVDDADGLRDTDGNPVLSYKKEITWDLTIDGTQDIMAAKANPVIDAAKAPNGNVKVSQAYSAYAARRDVHPTLKFNHLLTRFNFYVVAGSESGETTYVTGIEVKSKTKACLTVAPNISFAATDTTKSNLALMQQDVAGKDLVALTKKFPYVYKNAEGAYEYEYETLKETGNGRIGASVMDIPGETSHKIYVNTEYDGSNLTLPAQELTLKASDIKGKDGKELDKFEAGCQYDVILKIYGPEKVEITAVLTPWEEGGYAVIDPDADGPLAVTKATAIKADETSYNTLPKAYLDMFPWEENKDNLLNGPDALPWIAIEFTPEQKIEVVAVETATGHKAEFSFPKENTKIGLLTLCARELGVDELKGEWIVTINDIPKIITFE